MLSLAPWTSPARAAPALRGLELRTLAGKKQPLLAGKGITVLVFFRLGQQFSLDGLRELQGLVPKLARKPVRLVGLVSDRFDAKKVRAALRAVKVTLDVLRDQGELLQAKLAIRMHPTVVLLDHRGALRGRQVFRKVNFATDVDARIRRALGEISEAELQKILDPPPSKRDVNVVAAARYLRMARMLLMAGSLAPALASVRKSIALDAKQAAAHALAGRILQAQKNCPAARKAYRAALALDPARADARAGEKACR